MESIEKLRRLAPVGIGRNDFMAACDAVEREIAERYMELPVDRKNEPWRIGDKFSFADASGKQHICTVSGVSECEVFFYYDEHQDSTKHRHFKASSLVHVKPDPVKELLRQYRNELEELIQGGFGNVDSLTDDFAARIREAVSAE